MVDDLARRGTADFYREQVSRLLGLAASSPSPSARLELLDMATVFHKLAERAASTVADLRDVSEKKSA